MRSMSARLPRAARVLNPSAALIAICFFLGGAGLAQTPNAQDAPADGAGDIADDPSATVAPEDVAVEPVAADEEISARLRRILNATEWFESPDVNVDEGVVFLTGTAGSEEQRNWAGNLARNTQDVVAVVNRIDVTTPSPFDVSPARAEFNRLLRQSIELAPSLAVVVVLLALTWFAAKLVHYLARQVAARRVSSPLLPQIIAKAAALPVILIGAYLALRLSGLTRLAATVLGGTGLIGLIVGIAFRDIAENFLASVLISVKRPFNRGDLILIEGNQGFVQTVTTRGTTLMTHDGNHIQIPNAVIYKSVIHNFTANPNMRLDFTIGVDYGDSIAAAQSLILNTILGHRAVLEEPEPLVLVHELASSTVNLQALFWVNIEEHSHLKVRSAVIRLVKRELDAAGFTLPDESREVIFPNGVPVRMLESPSGTMEGGEDSKADQSQAMEPATSSAEGDLSSDRVDIERQAKAARNPEQGQDLLESEG